MDDISPGSTIALIEDRIIPLNIIITIYLIFIFFLLIFMSIIIKSWSLKEAIKILGDIPKKVSRDINASLNIRWKAIQILCGQEEPIYMRRKLSD